MLQQQYTWTQYVRETLLSFVETAVGDDLNTPMTAYDNKTICDLLWHSADCYFAWIVRFAGVRTDNILKAEACSTLPQLRRLYGQVDEIIAAFLKKFGDNPDESIKGRPDPDGPQVTATPRQIFMHVVSHEFHHKGQIVLMCRLMGHIPPETDLSLVFPYEG